MRPFENRPATEAPSRSDSLKPLTCLSLAGTLLFAGCGEELSTHQKVQKRPHPTVTQIATDVTSWEGKQVAVNGNLTIVSSDTQISSSGGNAIRVTGVDRYTLSQVSNGTTNHLTVINAWSSGLYSSIHPGFAQECSVKNKLQSSTFLVTGTLKKFSDANALYLELDGSIYQE